MKQNDLIKEELIYGAFDRERLWRKISFCSMAFGAVGCLLAGIVAISVDKPAPELVAYDVRNGVALPSVKVAQFSINQKDAIIESLIYSYVVDREAYNYFDNDLRIISVKNRSVDRAKTSLIRLWDSSSPDYLGKLYNAKKTIIDVAVSNINLLSENRAQLTIRKRLTNGDGTTEGSYTVTLEYELRPEKKKNLNQVWENPFGFVVTEYRIVANQYE